MKFRTRLYLPSMKPQWHLMGLSVVSILLRWYVPLFPKYGSVHDDELLVGLAHSMKRGDWIGSFALSEGLILSKPPGYSVFLYFASFIPIPSTVLIQIAIVCSALVIHSQLLVFGVRKAAALIGFVITLFLPVWFGAESSRLYRDFYLAALMLLVVALNLALVRYLVFDKIHLGENKNKRWKAYLLVFVIGLICSNVVLTKNVGFAPIVFSVLSLFLCAWKLRQLNQFSFRFLLICLVVFLVGTQIFVGTVRIQNHRNYGVAITNNFTEGEFPRAVNMMASVKSGDRKVYVIVTKEMRNAMYAVSPTLQRISSYLEQPDGTGWRYFACNSPMEICDESALWFAWDIREAVHLAGMASSARDFEQTFKSIADEIENACIQRSLTCGRKGLAPQIGPWDTISKRHLIESMSTVMNGLFGLSGSGGFSLEFDQDLNRKDYAMWSETINGLPKNVITNNILPDVKSGFNTVNGLGELFNLPWRLFFFAGLVGYFIAASKKQWSLLLAIGGFGIVPLAGLAMQLAIADTQTGLYASFPPYYLPLYPFLILSLTVGLNILLSITSRQEFRSDK